MQRVGVPVVLAEVPVQLPHVLPPAGDLPDEALHTVQRSPSFAPRRLRLLHALGGIEQAEVERGRQQAVAHDGVGGEHGVLVRPERAEPVFHEPSQGFPGLGAGRGKQAWHVPADEGDVAVLLPAVEVVADLVVDVVLAGAVGAVDRQDGGVAGRRLPVVVSRPRPLSSDGRRKCGPS